MRSIDYLLWWQTALRSGRLRSLLSALGIAIGILAVTALTGIGEGVRLYLLDTFSQFGSRLIAITPGKTETAGAPQGLLASSRPLRLEDVAALRALPGVLAVVPVLQGQGEVRSQGLTRQTTLLGTDHQAARGWQFTVAAGRFMHADDSAMPRAYAVLGAKVAAALYPQGEIRRALGSRLRVGDRRFVVTGVMAPQGQFLGFDLDDMVFIPLAHAQALFASDALQEIDVVYRPGIDDQTLRQQIRQRLIQRHGAEDFTLYSQQDMLSSLDRILVVVRAAIGGLGTVSLLIGAVGIYSIMSIAQQERIPEIGLLLAIGAGRRRLLWLFLGEAMLLALAGGGLGLLLLFIVQQLLHSLLPALPLTIQPLYLLLALLVSALVGLLAGFAPAWRASHQDPVVALRGE